MLRYSWQRRAVAALATVALGAAGASTTFADTDEGAPAVESNALAMAVGAPTTAVPAVPAEVREHFALFRDRPASGMPADVAEVMASPERFGRNPALARSIDTVRGKGWVVPGDGYLCVVLENPIAGYGTSCVPTADAIRQGLRNELSDVYPDGQVAVTVVLPDGARAVRGDGSVVPARDSVSSVLVARGQALNVAR